LRLECRSTDPEKLDGLARALEARAREAAATSGLKLTIDPVGRHEPAPTTESVRAALETAAAELGLTTMELPSGAGHDAQPLSAITPSGMIFVPSRGGISHDPAELSSWGDCVNGANVLLNAAVRLAEGARG
jgi:N-carbamoyl-L-amino-acid hydrolase